jgi:hypothetical protein
MRILGILGLMMFLCLGPVFAATVNLTNGNVVQGEIIKQDSKGLQVSVDGVAITYYADEIKDIDGKPFAAGQTQPAFAAAAPAPAVQHAVAAPASVPQPEVAVQPEAVAQPAAAVQPGTVAQEAIQETSGPAPVAGTSDQDKKALILKFIDVFGTRRALTNNFDLMLKQIEKEKPDEAQKIRQRVKVDEIIERLLPVYERNFTSEDLKAFIAFYGSAEGQKLISTIPELMQESVQVSIKYMKEKFPEAEQQRKQ